MCLIRIGLRTPFEFVPEAAGLGYDYLELPLTRIAAQKSSAARVSVLAYVLKKLKNISQLGCQSIDVKRD